MEGYGVTGLRGWQNCVKVGLTAPYKHCKELGWQQAARQ